MLYAAQAAYDAYRGTSAGVAGALGAAVGGNVAVDSQGHPVTWANGQPQGAAKGGKGAANVSGVSLRIGIDASSASAHSDTHDDISYGSHIQSAGDVTIAATNGDLNVIGSQVSGDNVALAASHDLNLLSQAEQHTQSDHSANARGELGFSIGSQTGFYATADGGKGVAHGNGTTYADTSVTASDTLSLVAGNDANIIGAQAKGNTVLASIGHDLTVESQQTTDDYASHTWQAGCTYVYGSGSEVHASAGMVDSSYKSVDQVSGIGAGDGGFQVHVGGHTDLTGAVIASTADPSLNLLDTGTLSFSDLKNQASYSAMSAGISIGSGSGGTSASPSIGVPQFGDKSSTTQAGIAQGTIITRDDPATDLSGLDRTPDIDAAGLKPIFDQQKVADQQELGTVAGQVGMRAAGDIASYEANHATTEEEQKSWQDGGANKVLLHGLVGAATAALGGGSGLQGALGAAASERASGAMQDYLVQHGILPNDPKFKTLMQLGSVAVGAVAGGGSGVATALQGEQFNRQLHPDEKKLIETVLAKQYAEQHPGMSEQLAAQILEGALSLMVDQATAANANYDPQAVQEAQNFLHGYALSQGNPTIGHDQWGQPVPLFGVSAPYQRQDTTIFSANPQMFNAPQALGIGQVADWSVGWMKGVTGVLNPANAAATVQSTVQMVTDPQGWMAQQQQSITSVFAQAQQGNFAPAGQVEGSMAGNAAMQFAVGYGVAQWGGTTSSTALTIKPDGRSIWSTTDTISPGAPWEAYVIDQQNLTAPPTNNFRTFDGFDLSCGLAVSCKAMNLDMPGYTGNPSAVYYTLKKYVDAAANFTRDTKAGFQVLGEVVPNRTIELAVPPNPTPAQLQQLQRAVDYANKQGIKLNISTVK